MAGDDPLDALVARADLDGLVRLVDERCTQRDWEGLLRLRDRSRHAVDTGRQLWPAATLAEYRLALLAPGPWAARVLTEDAGRFAAGPLAEVAASTHTWAELAPHLPDGLGTPLAAMVAHERVVRGEDLRGDVDRLVADPLGLPLVLQGWEPAYPVATYGDEGPDAPTPAVPSPGGTVVEPIETAPDLDDPEVEHAVRELVAAWTARSEGRCVVGAVEGGPEEALGVLDGLPPAVALAPLGAADAMAWLAWAGASGGAHARRRGAAAGRFGAWWVLAALGGLTGDWPVPAAELGELAQDLHWWWFDDGEAPVGWRLQIVVHDPDEGLAWVLHAVDAPATAPPFPS